MIAKPRRSLRILVTAGPTREAIDRVRFISNASTGKMGYELARLAQRRGHRVILISGPTNILPPKGVEFVSANTALQMRDKVKQYFQRCDCLIMAAAVSDFRPRRVIKKKIKKADFRRASATHRALRLELAENPDILLEMGKKKEKRVLVGFALETENLIKNARAKLKKKNLDLIVANQLTSQNSPFGDRRVKATIVSREGKIEKLTPSLKRDIAKVVLKRVEDYLAR